MKAIEQDRFLVDSFCDIFSAQEDLQYLTYHLRKKMLHENRYSFEKFVLISS